MNCPTCGSPTNSKFCSTCGQEVSGGANPSAFSTTKAGFWRRAGATVLDGIIVGLPASIVISLVTSNGGKGTLGISTAQYLLALAVMGIYQVQLLASPAGQTLGDKILKIKVVDLSTGGSLTSTQSLKRWIASALMNVLSAIFLIGIIDVLWCLWDKDGQTLHDKFAGTTAVKA
jgi:uncharacterized RDD family membrane protein YckC